jgi:hypothetical protein
MAKDSTTSNSERSIIEELKRNKLAYETKLRQYELVQQNKKKTQSQVDLHSRSKRNQSIISQPELT